MDIAEFLNARLDEDEADARAAVADRSATAHWEAHGWYESNRMMWIVRDAEEKYASHGYPGHTPVAEAMPGGPRDGSGVAAHIARHDPDRVLREVEGKRRVLRRHRRHADAYAERFPGTEYDEAPGRNDANACEGCGFSKEHPYSAHAEHIDDCPELRNMAMAYSDHPDYESWRS